MIKLVVKFLAEIKDHKVIVIDEVDQFNSHERTFTALIKSILASIKSEACNTSVIGIANSVDLPFKKKHTAIAMRDCQLLFRPYEKDCLQYILERKKNDLFERMPQKMKTDQFKNIYQDLIDPKVYEFIAKKVSLVNGDIRAAFDMVRSAVSLFAEEIKIEMPSRIRISLDHMLRNQQRK